jgi:hypothetical protein
MIIQPMCAHSSTHEFSFRVVVVTMRMAVPLVERVFCDGVAYEAMSRAMSRAIGTPCSDGMGHIHSMGNRI